MKRKNALISGNILMGLGLVTMIGGVAYSILNQLPQLQLPQFLAHGAMMSIFIGAMLWLAGARISGREKVCDRYYWLRHYGSPRCRQGNHDKSSHHSH